MALAVETVGETHESPRRDREVSPKPPHPVVVVGSLNIDFVITTGRLPVAGETATGVRFATFHGGKGANQAVAAARMGARVCMVGRVGADAFGTGLVDGLRAEGIDVSQVKTVADTHSGVASITVDSLGQNTIIIVPGANYSLNPAAIAEAADLIETAGVVALQLEVPMESVAAAARSAKAGGALVILDPAPAVHLPADLYPLLDAITPNEVEAEVLVGFQVDSVASAADAATELRQRGARRVFIKLGAMGVWADFGDGALHIKGLRVQPVDTTAAGDVFSGALAALVAEGMSWRDAATVANAAAALSTTRMGAQTSIPTRREVDAFLPSVSVE